MICLDGLYCFVLFLVWISSIKIFFLLCAKVAIDRPDWILSLSFDGFDSHTNVTKALDIFTTHNIWIIKEEAATSHVNQAYDQVVAKKDKTVQ